MKKLLPLFLTILSLIFCADRSFASHGMALITPNFTVGATGLTFTASSDAATCGGGPYWLQVELRCTASQLTGTPPATMQTNLLNWTGPGVTYNNFPWYNSLLNVPNYNLASSWPDACVVEPYHPVFIPFTSLCPGQQYFFSAREWVSGTNSVGPWTAPSSFIVPGAFTPLNFNVVATPTIYCAPGQATLSVTGITGGCGQSSLIWLPSGSTVNPMVVSPLVTTTYTAQVSTPCNTLTKPVTVNVVPGVSAAFTPVNSSTCVGSTVVFNHTGTAGVTHTWAVTPGTATITTVNSASPSITFGGTGVYTISHTVAIGSCTNVVTTNMTVNGVVSTFTSPSYTQCLQGNSFTFNATAGGGTHTYNFNPVVGAPPTGNVANYGPVSFTAPGTFTVSHTVNSGGCISTTNSVVVVNPQPSGALTPSNATCGNNNGQIIISNTSGPGQTVTGYSVNGVGVPTQTVINLAAGSYTVSMVNNYGCLTSYVTNITNTPPITALATTTFAPKCGASNGSITIGAVTGGTPTYSYNINGGPFTTSPPLTGLAPGTYTIGVRDSQGCVFTKTVVLTNVPGPTALSFTTTPSSCSGAAGSVTIGVTGGTAAYTYSINGVTSGSTATGLASGNYTATVRDANGCLITANFVIGTLTGPSAANVVVTNATCGNANGSATVTSVTGGTGPYQYSWNGGPFGPVNNVASLAAGTYTVIVRDANTCTISVVYNIVNGGSPVANIATNGSVTCNGASTGSLTVSVVGGTPGYNYTLTPTALTNATGIFTGLTAQAYTIIVRDAAGCTTSVTATINQPTGLTLNLTPANVSCNAGTNGSITAIAGGGTIPYQYSLNGGPFGGSSSFTGLTAGVYTVTVRDANNCTRTTTTTITQPTPLAVTFTTSPTTCVGSVGAATIGVTGGTPAYSYSVNGVGTSSVATALANGSYTASVSDANGCIITGNFNINLLAGPTAATVNTSPATCGNSNGSGTVTAVTGGAAPYQYSFNGGPFSLSNNTGGLAAGTHTVVVRDANSCTLTITFNVNNTGSPTSSISSSVNVACFGGNTGSFSVTTSGGTPGYSYTLSPVGTVNTTGNFTGLTAQNYNVTVQDAVGCVTTVTITINQPTQLTLTLTPSPVSCNAGSNGSVTASAGGGTPGYQYSINGGPFGGSGNFTGLTAGTYTVTVRDNNNCTFTQTAIITQPTLLNIAVATSPNSCAGSVGGVTITPSGGTPAYTYSVDGNTSASTSTGLTSGTHTATIMDANGCIRTTTFNIGNIPGPVSTTVTTTNANCGNANGSATLTGVTGGTAPYQYSWNGGPFSTNAFTSGLLAGTHTVTVIDANTCTLTVTYNVGNTGSPVSSIGSLSNVSCFSGANGSFTINTAGGTPGYSYTLTPTNATSGSGIFTGLTAQPYSVLVKDAAGCVTTVTVNITQPTALTLTLSSLPTLCNGSANGTITAAGSGGTGPYQYNLNGGPFQASGTFAGVGAAIYNITVRDANNCTLTQSVQVTQPAPITLTLTSVNANCTAANGTASVTASGGTPFYNYSWTGGGGTGSQTNLLVAGVYSVTVTDANGCTRTGSVTISSTPGGTAVIASSIQPTCFGFNNGSMTAGFTGAMSAPISYSWSNGQTTQTANNLIAGPYTVTLTDAFGCTSSASGVLTEPGPLDMLVTHTNVTCFGGNNGIGNAIYNGGGTPPLTYLWAPGGATTATAPNLSAGVYSMTATDSKGCTLTLTIQVTQPTSVTITNTVTTANCNQSNGSATITASGGAGGPYTYTWSTGANTSSITGVAAGTYSVIVKDANGCPYTSAATVPNSAGPSLAITGSTNVSCFGGNNGVATTSVSGGSGPYVYLWSNGQTTGTGTNLMAGIYSATVTDVNGCIASASVTITQPTALALIVSGTDPKCFNATNGSANAGVSGGTPGYTYNWVPSGSTAQSPTGLGPGNHLVTVTDANGCIINGSVTLNNPPQMTAAITSTNVTCFGACNGMANGTTGNSVGAVVYFWTGGPGPLTTQNVTNLCPGTYTLLATDANGCTAQALTTITEPPLLTASITASGNPSCATYTNGFATVAPAGGTPGYTYSWSPSGGTGSTENGLGAGTYVATITDSKGCTASTSITITQPTPLAATITSTNVTCFGLNNGIGNVAYSGGTGPYNFLWFPTLNNTPNVGTLPPGTHTVQITDNLGCITTLTTNITQPPALTAAISSTNSNCTQANGHACVVAGGGAGGYTYQWTSNPLFTNSCINNVVAGAYTVTVTDVNGCTINAIANINDIAGPSVAVTATTAVLCFGGSNGSANTNISGGTGTISVLWSYLAQTSQNVNNLPAGLHSITITDAAGCVASASVLITQPTQLNSAITNVTNVSCSGSNNGSATMLVNGGTPGYTYLWSPSAQSSSMAVSMGPGTYTCSVTDANGCPTSQTVTITQPNPLTITSFSVTNLTCNGNNTGQIQTTISGGSPAYTLVWSPAQPANAVITNLAAGTYSLLVTDTQSCTTTGVYVVTEPAALSSAATATPATCGNANGSATVTVNGGTPGYTYNWNTPTIQTTAIATGMAANTWSCTITDSKGCIITQSVTVPNAPGPANATTSFTAPLCFGQQNGSMAVNFTSGTSPYTFIWNNPSASTTQTVNGVGAGVYSATVTDFYGCTTNAVVNVTQPNILLLNISPDVTICYGQLTQIYAAGAGGTPAYSYTWNVASLNGGGPHAVTPTVTTQYIVNMSDANGCTVNPKTINVNVTPQLLATGGMVTRCDGKTVNLSPTITSPGNGGPYTYNWTGGSTSSNITVTASYPTSPNIYTVTISDGCTVPDATAIFTVNVNPLPNGSFTGDILKGCAPLGVNFTALSNVPGAVYEWHMSGGTGSNENGSPKYWIFDQDGQYTVQLTITNPLTGCKKDTTAINYIEVYPVPIAEFIANPWESTILDPIISFTNLSVGGTSYYWDFGDIDDPLNNTTVMHPSHAYENAGVYKVWLVAFNDKGCKDTVMHTVEILGEYALYIPNTFTPDGNGLNDIFQPKGVGIDEESYKMYIFDRWGEIIFTSDEFRKGWDGKVKGTDKQAEQGVYTYKILVKDYQGNVHPYIGHVNCLPRQEKVD